MKAHWRLNLAGVLIYLILVGWLLVACTVRIFLNLETGDGNTMAYVGLGLGALGLIGIGFGHARPPGED